MKQQITEIKRMQQLAGIIKEFGGTHDITPFDDYLETLMGNEFTEDAKEGEEINGVLEKNEYADEEAYDDADQFIPTYDFIKTQGGKYTLEGNPSINFIALKNGDIAYKYIATFDNYLDYDPDDDFDVNNMSKWFS